MLLFKKVFHLFPTWSALSTMPTLQHLSPQVPDFAILSRLHLSTSLVLYALLVCCVYCFCLLAPAGMGALEGICVLCSPLCPTRTKNARSWQILSKQRFNKGMDGLGFVHLGECHNCRSRSHPNKSFGDFPWLEPFLKCWGLHRGENINLPL